MTNNKCIVAMLIIFVVLVAWLLLYLPECYFNNYFKFNSDVEKLNSIKDLRNSMINICGGILAVTGLYFTYRRTIAIDKKNEIDETKLIQEKESNQNELLILQFTKASELLKDENLSARISGIYLFEKILNKHKEYYFTIIEILTAFVRAKRNKSIIFIEAKKIDFDVQAILRIIGRRNIEFEKDIDEDIRKNLLDLSNCNLSGYHLSTNIFNGNYSYVNFYQSDLSRTVCVEVNFSNALLGSTNFDRAIMYNAKLFNANVDRTVFTNIQGLTYSEIFEQTNSNKFLY